MLRKEEKMLASSADNLDVHLLDFSPNTEPKLHCSLLRRPFVIPVQPVSLTSDRNGNCKSEFNKGETAAWQDVAFKLDALLTGKLMSAKETLRESLVAQR